jgi:uncharacterized protein
MQAVPDLLRRALQIGDEQGWVQVRARHLPANLVNDLVSQTHEYALAHATRESPDGWLIFRDGIEPWWSKAANLTKAEFKRLFHLRTDVVKQLTEQGLAQRRNPRSILLYVRRDAMGSS